MFTLKITVADKHITEALERLKGIAETIKVDYEPGRKANGKTYGKTYAKVPDPAVLLTDELNRRGVQEINGPDFKGLVEDVSLNPVSASYYVNQLVKVGTLKKSRKVGNVMFYRVTGK